MLTYRRWPNLAVAEASRHQPQYLLLSAGQRGRYPARRRVAATGGEATDRGGNSKESPLATTRLAWSIASGLARLRYRRRIARCLAV
jgi:hypothetical protein